MHIDLDEFQDSAVEIWHSRVWNFSICITSEQYTHYSIFSEIHQDQSIFSFNFVQYSCLKKKCQCHQISSEKSHIKRVLKIACDFQRETITSEKILLKIQWVVIAVNVVRIAFDSLMNVNEFLSIKNNFHYLSKDSICMSELNVLLNYSYESWIKTQMQVSWFDQLFIWRVLNLKKKLLWSLNQCHSIWAELKLATYTKQHFMQKFDKAFCIFISLLTFIDEFELYNNMYWTLMKLYLIIIFFIFRECARRINVLSLTLESHDSNFSNVVDTLSFMTELNAELITFIDDKELFLCVFILVYIKNMFQQQKNFDFMNHEAYYDCRFCFIHSNDRINLEFNIIKEDWFHHEVMCMWKNMKQMKILQKNKYCTSTDLNQQMSLAFISLTLDIILIQSVEKCNDRLVSSSLLW